MTARKKRSAVAKLLDASRPSLNDFSKWLGISRSLLNHWREGKLEPPPEKRAALVKAMRRHLRHVATLTDAVEAEGKPVTTEE